MNIAQIYLYRIIYGVCLFTFTVRYSSGQCVIQIVKVVNIGLIYLYSFFMEFVYSLLHLLISWPVRYLNRVDPRILH